ncbi:MAG: L-serine ammonia-lyase, iron-sulfur-dependent, subunit alpha [Proteocatella sp.]|nr:L-serine ammonia-lyase, iron-sulfur-dependent, subunit alpha [Proteocatella sp.]MBP7913399.1 L-serine ammonia-lyase, iron-sulfur-dependent, subunit alpha [Proteocatella sp.]MBP8654376.1 L-serine ammonia-lyase, iron-sulfur-dependent, subunit alpha [Proteocatella sp.]MBP9659018.1 L-serine ammonia-lyase, iron-sulfur-dependent, subunit alpha [Proteocatella sp.]MBP9967149.1 L-serine ammonia-lyase, iron-sulfur-dependent, subunit alpha [Proteocatella sp.]
MKENNINFDFANAVELLALTEETGMSIAQVMLRREVQVFGKPEEKVLSDLMHSYNIMKNSTKKALNEDLKSMGGLLGGEEKLIMARKDKNPVCGSFMSKVIAYSMGVLEVNTSMGLIVAAPTAGSSGVIPGVFTAIQEEYDLTDDQMMDAMLVASAVGYIITRNATVSGAEGGCQAEMGSASAMAAAAITEIMGGTPSQALDAASSAIGNMLGLVCDPIAGLVEVPCQKRNAMGASNALICAEMTLAGVINHIPFDQTVDAMYQVGRSLPYELRETALGGLAATKAGCNLCSKIFG